jgi:multidrug efflux pump subunit AcrA (membrane-fusion protein)
MNRNPHFWHSLVSIAAVAAAAAAARAAEDIPAGAPGEFEIPLERQQQIGVTFEKAARTPLRSVLRAAGTVAVATQRAWDSVARVDGYIHDLEVLAPGDAVSRGQALMDIYSPDLASTEREYLDLLRMRDTAERSGPPGSADDVVRLIDSARERLRQWNVPDAEIAALEATRRARQYLTLVSPVDGIVESIGVRQGQHVSAGDRLVTVADLSAVWVWANFYQEDLSLLKVGLRVTVSSSAFPSETFTGKIALVDPFTDEMKRTVRARIDIVNADRHLRPGMYVDVGLVTDRGEGLTVPVSSVLPTGLRSIVFVDRGGGRLEPRYIVLGRKYGDRYEVAKGIAEGERVVSSANFLVDAESKVQGALKSW